MRIVMPLSSYYVGGRADVPIVFLWVRGPLGNWGRFRFVIDTGATRMTIPTHLAARGGLRYRTDRSHPVGGLVGSTDCYRDSVHTRIGGVIYEWECDFVRTPAGSRADYGVLGRQGFLEAFDFCYTSTHLSLTRIGPWHQRFIDSLKCPIRRRILPDRPL